MNEKRPASSEPRWTELNKERLMRSILLLTGVLALTAVPLTAQEKGTVELGGFGRFTRYDGSFATSDKSENSYGGGGRLGYFLSPKFSIEADGSFNASDLENYFVGNLSSPLRYWPFHLRGLFHLPMSSRVAFLVGAGGTLNYYGKSNNPQIKTINGTDVGVGGLAGFRFKVNSWLSLRIDGTADYMPSPANSKDKVTSLGTTDPTVPSDNTHLGLQAGLSIFPNARCTRRLDAIDLLPNTATVATGQSVQLNVTGRLCDGSSTTPQVTYTVTPSGTIGPNGMFSSGTPGSYRIVARTLNGKLSDTSTVTVNAPPPPPPPPPTLSRITIAPASTSLKLNESASFTVTGYWSDGTSRAMRADECTLSADGNPTASGWQYTWSRSGDYGVTATCGGQSSRAAVSVRGLTVTFRAIYAPARYAAASAIERGSLDSVAAVLKADPTMKVYIDGHTDWQNTVRYNAWLAQQRAQAIQQELIGRGIERERLIVRSFGECAPAGDNSTAEGRAQNRRVEVNQVESATPQPANASCAESGPAGTSRIGRPG